MLFRGPALAPGPQEQFRLKTPKRAHLHARRGGFQRGVLFSCSRFMILKGGTGREQVAGTTESPKVDLSDGTFSRCVDPYQT